MTWQAASVPPKWFKQRSPQQPPPASSPEHLGVVDTGSGDLVLLDFGNLALWSGDATPVLPAGLLGDDLTEVLNGAVDYEIVGPDAEATAIALDMAAVSGTHAFDVPGRGDALHDALAALRAEHGLDAELRVIDRMPHRERLRTRLDRSPTGAEVPFHGVWAVAVRGLPVSDELPVYGVRMDADGPDAERWSSVWVEVAEGEVVTSQPIGYVLVDRARLMFADPDALPAWNADGPRGGLVDLAFWGRDAEAVASHLDAEPFSEGGQRMYGWRDRPTDEIRALGARLRAHVEETAAKVAMDFRPHDDDQRILSMMRDAPTGSAAVAVAGRTVCGFFTSWGDGAYPVYRDLGRQSQLLRVRVELGAPEIVARARRMEELWFGSLSKLAIVSPAVARGAQVRWLEREGPLDDRDSGWCVYAGTETQEELDEPGATQLVPLRELIQAQPELESILATPAPAAFELVDDGSWRAIPPPPG